MILESKLTSLVIFILFYKFSNCDDGCTPFTPKNLGSINGTILESTIEAGRRLIPVFDSSIVPDIDSFIDQFNAGSNNEDIHLNITQLLTKYGYGAEQHEVQTSDGYLLNIFRIPGNGPVVLVMHGVLCSSDDFVTSGPGRGLAYLLADQGYDVWLGNVRGNKHGRKHLSLSPNCAEFWDFSFEEMGEIDLPNTIDYILETTGEKKINYVGHSQGNIIYFVMNSEFPDYNDKISVMVSLSAVTFLKNSKSPVFNLLAPIEKPFSLFAKSIGLYELLPRNPITDLITSIACGTPATAKVFCNNLSFVIFGFDYPQVNATILPTFYGHFPSGSSLKQLVHVLQLVNSGKFGKYDYGLVGNMKKYGSSSPPDFYLDRTTSKVVNVYSDGDYFTAPPDREEFESKMPNIIEVYRVPLATFTHGDFLYANDLKTLVNDKVIEFIQNNS